MIMSLLNDPHMSRKEKTMESSVHANCSWLLATINLQLLSVCQAAFAGPVSLTLAQTDFFSGQHLVKSAGQINQDTQTNMITHYFLNALINGKQLIERTKGANQF